MEFDEAVGSECNKGFSPITSRWQLCQFAGSALGYTGDVIAHVKYDGGKAWATTKPQGCFQSGGAKNPRGRIHFNRGAGGPSTTDKIICWRNGT